MKRIFAFVLVLMLCISAAIPAGAYDYDNQEWIFLYNYNAFTRKKNPAVKWNGRTTFQDNTYYYTASSVTITHDVTLPENSTLEVRKGLNISKGAKLTVCGTLLVDYNAKINPVNGTLKVEKKGYVQNYGALAVSKKGVLDIDGHLLVMESGRFNVKGTVNVQKDGRAVYAGSFKKYPGAKINGDIIAATNVKEPLSEELSRLSDDEKICVDFLFYDSDTSRNATVDGKNILDISLEIQDKYSIPAMISYAVFDNEPGSYAEYKSISQNRTDALIRYLKTNYGGRKGFNRYLSNEYFSNITENSSFQNADAEIPSDNKFIVSESYQEMFSLRAEILQKLNKALSDKLTALGFEEMRVLEPLKNGYGAFSAKLTKAQINALSSDDRFLFMSVDDGKTAISGIDKLYISDGNKKHLGYDDWNKITEQNGNTLCVVSANDVIPGGENATDNAYKHISQYTDVTWDNDNGTWYSTSVAGEMQTNSFFRTQYNGLYSFHGFWDELRSANHNINKNYILDSCIMYGLFNDCYVYHAVTVSSAEELKELVSDDSILLIIEGQAELE